MIGFLKDWIGSLKDWIGFLQDLIGFLKDLIGPMGPSPWGPKAAGGGCQIWYGTGSGASRGRVMGEKLVPYVLQES